MATPACVYAGFAFLFLGTLATILCIGAISFSLTLKDQDVTGFAMVYTSAISGFTFIFTALALTTCSSDAKTQEQRRQEGSRPESDDSDRNQRVRHHGCLTLLGSVFSWAWILIALFHAIVTIVICFLIGLAKGMFMALVGVPIYLMIPATDYLTPSAIRSLEIVAGSATERDIPMN